MFYLLFLSKIALAAALALLVARAFEKTVASMFERIAGAVFAAGRARYIVFATYVAAIAGGVQIRDLENFSVTPTPRTP